MFERSSRSHSATCTGVGMVDKPVSETGAERHAGSSPVLCTNPTKSEPDLPYGRRVRILCFLQETVFPKRYALPARIQAERPEKEKIKIIWRF